MSPSNKAPRLPKGWARGGGEGGGGCEEEEEEEEVEI